MTWTIASRVHVHDYEGRGRPTSTSTSTFNVYEDGYAHAHDYVDAADFATALRRSRTYSGMSAITISTEMICDVESPSTPPRSSARRNSSPKRSAEYSASTLRITWP